MWDDLIVLLGFQSYVVVAETPGYHPGVIVAR